MLLSHHGRAHLQHPRDRRRPRGRRGPRRRHRRRGVRRALGVHRWRRRRVRARATRRASSCSTCGSPTAPASTSAARCASSACASRSSCSPCSPTSSTRSSASRWAPTTTSPSPTACASSSRASARSCAAPTASSPRPRPTCSTWATSWSTAAAATVTRDGRELNLTPTEYRLLVVPRATPRPGVLPRAAHRERVGRDGEFYDDKTVSVHVRRLREKIEAEPSNPQLVLTVPGIGYRLATDGRHASRASLRVELALTYAGIALLTAALLGGILLGGARQLLPRAETAYLRVGGATRARDDPLPGERRPTLASGHCESAISGAGRVRLYDAGGQLVADSGSVDAISTPTQLDRGPAGERGEHGRERLPQPLGEGIFGGESDAASTSTAHAAASRSPATAGYFELSEPPVSGRAVLARHRAGVGCLRRCSRSHSRHSRATCSRDASLGRSPRSPRRATAWPRATSTARAPVDARRRVRAPRRLVQHDGRAQRDHRRLAAPVRRRRGARDRHAR